MTTKRRKPTATDETAGEPTEAAAAAVTPPPVDLGAMSDRELLQHIAETGDKSFRMLAGVMKRLRALETILSEGSEKNS